MHYGIDIAPLGDLADPRKLVQLAQAAEAAGWEAVFVWDHLGFVWGIPAADPWVALAAIAQATTRIKLGPAVTPVARRRPQVLAHTVATLDVLSEGRVIFGAGLGGVPKEFSAFGESDVARERAEKLDEGLALMDRLWQGEMVSHEGKHYVMRDVQLAPLPVQRPRVPVWIGAQSQLALRRTARWDGWMIADDEMPQLTKSPAWVAEQVASIHQQRISKNAFDVAMTGRMLPSERDLLRKYEAAGVTWWLETIQTRFQSFEELLALVKTGPMD